MERDYRDIRTWDLGSYGSGMTEETRLNKPEVMHKQYHGDYVLTKDYLEACDEIDRLQTEVEQLKIAQATLFSRLSTQGLQLSRAETEHETILELLKDVVNQSCLMSKTFGSEGVLNPMSLSAYEGAIKWLVEHGHAVWIKKGYTARWKE